MSRYSKVSSSDGPEEFPIEKKETPDQVKAWHERVSIAKRMLDDWAQKSGVERIIEEYHGDFKIFFNGLKGNIPVPPINEIYAYVDADVSNTYNRDPWLSVVPRGGTVKGAKLWEVVLNYYWRKLKLKDHLEPEIIDKDLVGFAWHKTGKQVETEGAEEELKIVSNDLYSARVDWKDVVYNLGSKNPPYDCVWMAQRIVKPLKYIKDKYPNAKGLKGMQNPEISKNIYDKAVYKDDISVGVIWEIWDKDQRKIRLIAEGLNDMYLDDPRDWPEKIEEYPFLMYWDTYAPGKDRPMSAVAPWEAQVLEKMVLLAAAVNHSKRWNRQMLAKKGAISGNDLDKIERGDDGAIIEYTGQGQLDGNVKFIDWGSFPPDFMILMDRLSSIQRDVSGQPEFFRGGVTRTQTRTDGELDKIEAGAQGRQGRKLDRFETHMERIADQILDNVKSDFDVETAIRVTGWVPEEVIESLGEHYNEMTGEITFSMEDLAGDYGAEVKAGSTIPLNKDGKNAALKDVLNTLGNVDGASPLLKAIIGEYLDIYDIKALKQAFEAESAATAKQMQERDQELDAEEVKARSQAAKNMASAEKIGAETDKLMVSPPFAVEKPTMEEQMMVTEPLVEAALTKQGSSGEE